MATVRAAKQALRKELKIRLQRLTDQDRVRQSSTVTDKLIQHPRFRSSQRVAVFLSMRDEVQTDLILQHVFSTGKACFIPRYHRDSSHMDMLRLHSVEDVTSLPVTSWNIRQPAHDDTRREEALASGGLDLILMPGLGFDKAGHRLGRGKGYYDSYLQRCAAHPAGRPYTIALAFNEQLCDQVPVEQSDVPVDEVLYENS